MTAPASIPALIAEGRRLIAEATPGPLRANLYLGGAYAVERVRPNGDRVARLAVVDGLLETKANADRFVFAVNNLPALLDVAEAAAALHDGQHHSLAEEVRSVAVALAAPPPSDVMAATGEMGPARGYLAVCARSVDNVRTGWPPSDAVREAETPGTTRVEGHDEQATDTGRTEDETERRDLGRDAATRESAAVLGVQPADGAFADSAPGGVPDAVPVLRCGTTDEPVAPPPPAGAEVREAAERLWYRLTPPANVTENGCVFVPTEDLETVLRALRATASPAPGSEGVREAAESDVSQLRRLQLAEALLLDVWDAWHREGHEQSETIDAAIDRLGDWRWNEGYDPSNPPLRPDPRKARAARRGGQKGGA